MSKLRNLDRPLVLLAAVFTAAGGVVHLREWLDTYRDVPASVPGAAIVRVGFPVIAGVSVVLAVLLVATVFLWLHLRRPARLAAAALATASLAALVVSRNGSLLGWMESGWSRGAKQAAAVEVGALLTLLLAMVVAHRSERGAAEADGPAVSRGVARSATST